MKRLILSCLMLITCLAAVFCCSKSNAPGVYHSELLLWRMMLYGLTCAVGWHLHQRFPLQRPTIRRIALVFMVLVLLNEIVPEVSQ
ncbi:hypothetical protein PU088_000611 [Citrobacter farmeri]|uniref:Uncharacterized protein n=1 Tax=Citrobacter amalonaticus Y19 TaxID=1261127 RepID=A0A0F6RGK0_CITAM|nr:hypothetical protein [Citrobacter amalonaticus]AKE60113.1 hypothetical protein F384_16920 [Citrobacter amalonaticus Y19]EKV5653183.1 hypothetical protein [Citrobacter farmeri]